MNERYGRVQWAEQYDPQETEQATQLYRWFDSDPEGAFRYLSGLMRQQGYLKDEPQRAQPQPSQGQALTDPQSGRPLPDIFVQETGQRLYSADQSQKLVDWAMAQVDARVRSLEEHRSTSTMVGQAQAEARSIISDAERNWPYFNEFATQIYQELQRDGRLSLEGAYRRVVLPQIKERTRAEVANEIRSRASAGNGANPGTPSPASTVELRKLPLKELFKREMQRRGLGR